MQVNIIPDETFLNAIRAIVREEINNKEVNDLKEKMFSPEEACKLFNPAITKMTLSSYVNKGLIKKYSLGGRTWFKYNELMEAIKGIKKFARV